MTTLKERVDWILENRNVSMHELSLQAGLSGSHVSQLQRGERPRVSLDTIVRIAKAANVSFLWLAVDQGAPDDVVGPAKIDGHGTALPNRALAVQLALQASLPNDAIQRIMAADAKKDEPTAVWLLRIVTEVVVVSATVPPVGRSPEPPQPMVIKPRRPGRPRGKRGAGRAHATTGRRL